MDNKNFQVCDRDLPAERLDLYLKSDRIAVDTETMGLLPQRDRLCLVQLCDSEDRVTAIRVEIGQTAAPNLKRLLESPDSLKIFHFARFDLATLKHHLGIQVNPVFCTKIASKLSRTYSPRHGLKELVKEFENIELDKSAQSSDWGNPNNLTADQLSYAANDVRFLHNLQEQLSKMLHREGRWELAQRCFDCLPTLVELDLLHYSNIFEH